jgi:hypothetical protein
MEIRITLANVKGKKHKYSVYRIRECYLNNSCRTLYPLNYFIFRFCSLNLAFSNYDERKTNEMHFQSKPYIQNNNLTPTCFGAAGTPSSGIPKDPDEIVCMLSYMKVGSVSTPYLHLFGP